MSLPSPNVLVAISKGMQAVKNLKLIRLKMFYPTKTARRPLKGSKNAVFVPSDLHL